MSKSQGWEVFDYVTGQVHYWVRWRWMARFLSMRTWRSDYNRPGEGWL